MDSTIAVADCETNPFNKGQPVIPFVWGFYDGSTYKQFWDDWKNGKTCTELFVEYLELSDDRYTIYAHNGGKFDWLFLSSLLIGNIRCIGSRLVKASLGKHELRDSFANIPVPLKSFGNKLDFDYSLCEPRNRDKPANRALITTYLKQDCVGLYDAVIAYRSVFGNSLTMASAALTQLNLTCTGKRNEKVYECLTPEQDDNFRPFFFGGRVQCFKTGILPGPFKVYDVTSMYPSVMKDYQHPIAASFSERVYPHAQITETTDFAVIDAEPLGTGCLPWRSKSGLTFPTTRNTYFATGAEIRTALDLGLLRIHKIEKTITATEHVCFSTFITKFFNLRQQAKADDNAMLTLFYKLVLNSAYGKLAILPDKFEDTVILTDGELPPGELYSAPDIQQYLKETVDHGHRCKCTPCYKIRHAWHAADFTAGRTIWARMSLRTTTAFANVCAGASITGYARAKLMHGLSCATDPIYCDTDSIICRDMSGVSIGKNLGEWQLEKTCDTAAIAGKKLYALFNNGECVKQASKGVRLTPQEIFDVASGETIEYTQDAPMISLSNQQRKLTRRIRRQV
jgi:hypothetical protein